MKLKEILYMAALALGLSATTAPAAVIMTAQEIGGDVVFTASGTYDVTGLTLDLDMAKTKGSVAPRFGILISGNRDFEDINIYTGLTPASVFLGTGSILNPTTGASATGFGFLSVGDILSRRERTAVSVPRGTTTGSLDEAMTFASQAFTSIGLAEGVCDWAWEGDSARLTIGNDISVTPLPLPAGLSLRPVGLAGFGMIGHKGLCSRTSPRTIQ